MSMLLNVFVFKIILFMYCFYFFPLNWQISELLMLQYTKVNSFIICLCFDSLLTSWLFVWSLQHFVSVCLSVCLSASFAVIAWVTCKRCKKDVLTWCFTPSQQLRLYQGEFSL